MAQPSEMLPVVLVNVLSIAHRTDQLAPHKMTVQLSPSQVVFQGFSSIDLKLYPPTYQVNKVEVTLLWNSNTLLPVHVISAQTFFLQVKVLIYIQIFLLIDFI